MKGVHPQTLDARSAGCVARYHTWPHVRGQSVGEHTWQLIRILLAIYPDAPRRLMIEAMFHDVGERVSGDPPYPIKAQNPDLKREMDRIEGSARLSMTRWGIRAPQRISDRDRAAMKLAEFIEMAEWGWDDLALGNRNAQLILDRCLGVARDMTKWVDLLPPRVAERATEYINRRENYERRYRAYGK